MSIILQRDSGDLPLRITYFFQYLKKYVHPIIFFSGFLSLFLSIKFSLNGYDEGIVVFGAHRVLKGDVPYRDFWAVYPPGQFYMISAVFSLLGESVLVERIYHTVLCFFITLCLYSICSSFFSKKERMFIYGITSLWLASNTFYGYPIFPALLANLLSIIVFFRYIDLKGPLYLFFSGFLIGIALMFRVDFGVYGAVAQIIVILIDSPLGRPAKPSMRQIFAAAALYIMAVLIAPSLYSIYLFFKGGLLEAFNNVLIFAATTMLEVNRLPYPHPIFPVLTVSLPEQLDLALCKKILHWLRFYGPIFVYGVATFLCFKKFTGRKKEPTKEGDRYLLKFQTILFTGIMMMGQALNRYDWIHVLPTSFFTLIVYLWLFKMVDRGKKGGYKYFFMVVTLLLFLAYTIPFIIRIYDTVSNHSPFKCYSTIKKAGCVKIPDDQGKMVSLVVENTGFDEPIFVGNYKHDVIYANDIAFYFLADRRCGTYYHELSPGVATTLPVQKRITEELIEKSIKWVVLVDIKDPPQYDAKSKSSGINYLDFFLRANYMFVQTIGNYSLLKKQGED